MHFHPCTLIFCRNMSHPRHSTGYLIKIWCCQTTKREAVVSVAETASIGIGVTINLPSLCEILSLLLFLLPQTSVALHPTFYQTYVTHDGYIQRIPIWGGRGDTHETCKHKLLKERHLFDNSTIPKANGNGKDITVLSVKRT